MAMMSSGECASTPVDLGGDDALAVDISDALSEKEKVKFTVHTRTRMKAYAKEDMSVTREHDEFIWLHDSVADNDDYLGLIVPPPPARPDFEASRKKLTELGEGEATMTRDEFAKMKAELEAEYLANFKKTVATHELFLQRLAAHAKFRHDANLRVFLEYESDLRVRGKNKKELLTSFFGKIGKSADEVLLSGQKDVDEWFETEKNYLLEYHTHIRDATAKSDRATRYHKSLADSLIKTSSVLEKLATMESDAGLKSWEMRAAEILEKTRRMEARVASDADLKQSDTLRYFLRETTAAQGLLYRRTRCLANYEGANRGLERARAKRKDVQRAEAEQVSACERFEAISEVAKAELKELKAARVGAFKKAFVELGELQLKQAKAQAAFLTGAVAALRAS